MIRRIKINEFILVSAIAVEFQTAHANQVYITRNSFVLLRGPVKPEEKT
jgi:hypothetical protein